MTKNILFTAVLLVAGVWLTLYGIERPYWSMAARDWPTTQGMVISSNVETLRSRRSTTYTPKVVYSYKLGAKEYTSEVVEFSNEGTDQYTARAIVHRYPSGSTVTVHYSPSDPERATLEAGVLSWRDAIPIVIGLVLAGSGVLAGLEVLRGARKARAQAAPSKKK